MNIEQLNYSINTMSNKDPVLTWLVVFVSIIATIIGVRNLIWFTDIVNREVINIERKSN